MARFKEYIVEGVEHTFKREIVKKLEEVDGLVGVHMTDGVNGKPLLKLNLTRPSHFDPYGVYTFPKDFMLSGQFGKVRLFGEKQFAYILKAKEGIKILNLSKMSEQEYNHIVEVNKLRTVDEPYYRRPQLAKMWGGKLWALVERYMQENNFFDQRQKNKFFRNVFIKAGYDALLDEGDGIIHKNEPYQLVFLTTTSYDIVDMFVSKSSIKLFISDLIQGLKKYFDVKRTPYVGSLRNTNSYTLYYKKDKRRYIHIEGFGNNNVVIRTNYNNDNDFYKSIYSDDIDRFDIDEITNQILTYVKNNKPREYPNSTNQEEYPNVIESIRNTYNIRGDDKSSSTTLSKTYVKDESRYSFEIRQFKDELSLDLRLKRTYSNSAYIHAKIDLENPENVQEHINKLFEQADDKSDRDIKFYEEHPYDSDNKLHDMHKLKKFISLLRNRVFRPRSKRTIKTRFRDVEPEEKFEQI